MTNTPITKQSEICQILTCLPEKFIVDFANGITVARDHQLLQKQRVSIFARCYDGLTGQSTRRQSEINASLIDGVEASLKWLTDLTGSLAESNLAIAKVNNRLTQLKSDTAHLANYSFETRQQLETLAERLHQRCSNIEAEISRIDFIQRAEFNLNQVFARWHAGRFSTFSPAGRCFIAMEELRWGAFGDYCRSHSGQERQKFLDRAVDLTIGHLRNDLHSDSRQRVNANVWLNVPNQYKALPDGKEALAYIAHDYSPQKNPFVFVSAHSVDELPLHVPRIMSATRLTEALATEVFEGDVHA